MLVIDGSQGEGGGQVLRLAVALSGLTGTSIRVENIRAKRPSPGLSAQHMAALRCVGRLCDAEIDGCERGSTTVTFRPSRINGGAIDFDIGTAGSATLVLQAALLPAMFASKPVTLTLTGGTDVPWSPPFDYWREVFLPAVRRFCAGATLTLRQRGYYPAGGGRIELKVKPALSRATEGRWERFAPLIAAKVPSFDRTTRPRLCAIKGIAHASASLSPKQPAEQMAERSRLALAACGVPVDIDVQYSPAPSAGGGITLWAVFAEDDINDDSPRLGASALLGSSASAADAGTQAAQTLLRSIASGAPADEHLGDQLIPYLALAGSGQIVVENVSSHATTSMTVIEQILGVRFSVDKNVISRASRA